MSKSTDHLTTAVLRHPAENSKLTAELAAQYEELLSQFNQLQSLYQEQAALLAKLQNQAPTDEITGLANQKSFQAEVQRSLATARRHGRTHAVVVFTISSFNVLASLSEGAETAMLTHVARLLRQNIRPTDIAARLQGGTFAIILNEVRATDNARQRAAAIQDIVGQTPCPIGTRSLQLTLATGVRPFSGEDDADALVADAHAALAASAPATAAN
jgi:diguanylate cyclase (GGDEF)-like protein